MNNGHKTAAVLEAEIDSETAIVTEKIPVSLLLLQHRRFLLRSIAISTALFIVIALLLPPQYESVARLMPPERSELSMLAALSSHSSDAMGLSMGLSSLLGLRTTGALFVGILSSDTVEDSLVAKYDLRQEYRTRRWESARKRLASYSDIAEDRKNGIITVRVRDRRPDQARAMCQSYIDELNRLVVTLATSSARREREFLEERLKLAKTDLDQASRNLSQFSSQHTTIDIPQQAKAMVEGAAMLQGQLIAAESELKSLQQMYGPKHVRVRAVQARVDELQRQLNKLGELNEPADEVNPPLYPSIRKLPLLALDYAEYYRQAKIQEALYESLMKQYEVAKVEEAEEIPSVRVLDSPTFPERRVSPPRVLITISGALLGFGLGCGIVLGRIAWRQADGGSGRKALALATLEAIRDDRMALEQFVGRRGSA